MRITNQMMTNNMMNNINKNKNNLSKLDEQYSTGKKIQRPSDDPIIAVRALKLRTNLSELNQYYEKNIPDAMSWMDVTESALTNVNKMLTKINTYCVQGTSDTLTPSDRTSIIKNLEEFKKQIYQEGDTSCAGRYVFTGYKTDTSLIFTDATKNLDYKITEKLAGADIEEITKVTGEYALSQYNAATPASNDFSVSPSTNTTHRIRLAYDNLDASDLASIKISYTEVAKPVTVANITTNSTTETTINTTNTTAITTTSDTNNTTKITTTNPPTTVTAANNIVVKSSSDKDAYIPVPGTINFIPETGELILADDVYQSLRLKENLSVTYEKTEFDEGDLRPEHYFDCKVTNTDKPELKEITYTKEDQQIQYEVNFNQKLTINTQGTDALQHDVGRDIDEILEAVQDTEETEAKITEINKLLAALNVTKEQTASLGELKKQLNTELVLKKKIMTDKFAQGISGSQKQQNTLNVAVADLGSRYVRLELTESRLSSQQADFEDLLSSNEDVDIAETYIRLTSAENIYNASLSAVSKVIKNTLLDFL